MRITYHFNDDKVQNVITRLIRSSTDRTPVMCDIGNKLLKSTRDRFITQKDPKGKPWAPLSVVTKARKKENKNKILTQRGHLEGNLTYQVGRNSVEIGSPSVYANTHQFGAAQGEFGQGKSGAPIPWGNIPARPFLGVSSEDRQDIRDIVLDFVSERWV